jgi:hypothetical protein
VSRDPAENTSTSPLGRAVAELDGEDEAVAEEVGVEAGAEEEELEDELLQAAAVRPRHVMPSTAAMRFADVRLVTILRP